ncbi:MAG: DUF4760 domain-containing protein [Caulobacter sp.]
MSWHWLFRRAVPVALAFVVGVLVALFALHIDTAKVAGPIATLCVGALAASIALLAVFMTWRTILATRHNAKATVTFQHISKAVQDPAMIDARIKIRTAMRNGDISQFASLDKESDPTTLALVLILNDFEIVAIGIKRGIIDCGLYRAWGQKSSIDFYSKAEPFITALRARVGNQRLWINFAEMILQWDATHPNHQYDPNSPFSKGGERPVPGR